MNIEVISSTEPVEPVSVKSVLGAGAKTEESKELKADENEQHEQESDKDTEHAENEAEAESEKADDAGESKDEDSEKSSEETKEEHKPKKKGGFQKRIERFQKSLSQKDQEIEYLRSLLPQQKQEQAQAKPEVKEASGKPKIEEFDSLEAFTEAVTDWKISEKLREQEAKSQQAKVQTEYQQKVDEFGKKMQEFGKTVSDFESVTEDAADVMLTPGLQYALMKSKAGPEVLYNLAKDREALERINGLSASDQIYEVAMVEAELKFAKSQPKPEIKTKTEAPPPVKPVGAKSGTVKKTVYDDIPFSEWEQLRNAEIKQKRNRG